MNDERNMISNHWREIKEHIRAKWGKLSYNDIECARDNMDNLIRLVQKVYGVAESRAEREYHDFLVSLRMLFQPGRPSSVSLNRK